MCTISNKIKLCTCIPGAKVKNYWVLYRFVKGKNIVTIGEAVMPVIIDYDKDVFNQNLLLRLLNEGNAFDEPLYPVEKDRLQISFDFKEKGELNYDFIFKKNKWEISENDFFEWYSKYDEIKEGKVTMAK